MKRPLIALAVIVGLFGSCPSCLAQNRVITGDCMGFLTEWFRSGGSLDNKELENLLAHSRVTALWLPWPQNAPPYSLSICLRDKTQPDLRVATKKDLEFLHHFAEQQVFEFKKVSFAARQVRPKGSEIAVLVAKATESAKDNEKLAKRVCGSLLLDAGISSSDAGFGQEPIRASIAEFKISCENEAHTFLQDAIGKKQIAKRNLYVFGSMDLKGVDLLLLAPKDVKLTTLGGQPFRTAWVGSKLVFVPHDGDVRDNAPTAIEKLGPSAEIQGPLRNLVVQPINVRLKSSKLVLPP